MSGGGGTTVLYEPTYLIYVVGINLLGEPPSSKTSSSTVEVSTGATEGVGGTTTGCGVSTGTLLKIKEIPIGFFLLAFFSFFLFFFASNDSLRNHQGKLTF